MPEFLDPFMFKPMLFASQSYSRDHVKFLDGEPRYTLVIIHHKKLRRVVAADPSMQTNIAIINRRERSFSGVNGRSSFIAGLNARRTAIAMI